MKIPDILSLNNSNNSKNINAEKTFLDEMFQFEVEDVEDLQEMNEDNEEIKENDVFSVTIDRKEEKEENEGNEEEKVELGDEYSNDEFLEYPIPKNEKTDIKNDLITKIKIENEVREIKIQEKNELKEIKTLKEIMKIITVKELKNENKLEKQVEKIEIKIVRNTSDKNNLTLEMTKSVEGSDSSRKMSELESTKNQSDGFISKQVETKEVFGKETKMDIGTVKEKIISSINELTSGKAEVKVKNNEIKININIGENSKLTIKTVEQNGEIKIEIKSDIRLDNDMKKDLQEMVMDMSEEKDIKIELSIDDEGAENEEERTNEQKEKKKKRIQAKEGEFEKMMEGDEKNE